VGDDQNHRIEELERRVDELRQEAYELKQIIQTLKENPANQTHPIQPMPRQVHPVKPLKQKPVLEKEPIDWEKKIGQVWLPRIFIFVLLIGVIWAFKAVSTFGLLNEPIKVFLGFAAAAVLIYLGQKQVKRNRIALGHVLLGGSVVMLIISTFAMHILYGMVPAMLAFLLNILWIGLGIFLSYHYSSQPLAILTGVGGYLIPFLVESAHPSILNFAAFETIFYLALLIYAMKKNYQILYYVAFGFLHLCLTAGAVFAGHEDFKIFSASVILQHIFIMSFFLFTKSFLNQQMGIAFASFVLSLVWLRIAYPKNQFEMIVLIGFFLYAILSGVLWKKEKVHLSAAFSIASFALTVFFVNYFDIEDAAGLLMVQGFITIYLGLIAKVKIGQIYGGVIYGLGALSTFIQPFMSILSAQFVNWLLLIGTLFAFKPFIHRLNDKDQLSYKKGLHAVIMVVILFFITHFMNRLTLDLNANSFMAVSFAWAIYAFVTMVIGSKSNDKFIRMSGLIQLFLTLAKLIFVDLAYISLFIRAFLFILLGLIGIVISRIDYKK
jgi:uncharacterized membrane protein